MTQWSSSKKDYAFINDFLKSLLTLCLLSLVGKIHCHWQRNFSLLVSIFNSHSTVFVYHFLLLCSHVYFFFFFSGLFSLNTAPKQTVSMIDKKEQPPEYRITFNEQQGEENGARLYHYYHLEYTQLIWYTLATIAHK